MCLHLNLFTFKKTAKRDIHTFKILYESPKNPNKPQSFIQNYEYELGKLNTTKLTYDITHINYGFHSLATEQAVIDYSTEITFLLSKNVLGIYRCVIPKGAKYYKGKYFKRINGKFVPMLEGMASNQIIIKERIEFSEFYKIP